MRQWRVVLWTAAIIVAGDLSAHAVVTVSPPVRNDNGSNLGCVAQNLSGQPVEVESTLENGLNTVVDTQTQTIPAGETRLLARSTDAVFGAYCIFDFDANPTEVRGYIRLEDAGGSNTRLLYPARQLERGPGELQVDLYSPPVRNQDGSNLGCVAQNLNDGPVQVISELDNGLGTIVDEQTQTIPGGEVRLLARSTTQVFGAHCHFRFSGNPTQIRGVIRVEDAGGSNTRLLFPAEQVIIPTPEPATPTSTATLAGDAPTPTRTPTAFVDTPGPSATPTVPNGQTPGACCGDCNSDGQVRVDELVSAVNRALGGCPE